CVSVHIHSLAHRDLVCASAIVTTPSFSSHLYRARLDLHSFPTRRSSDLGVGRHSTLGVHTRHRRAQRLAEKRTAVARVFSLDAASEGRGGVPQSTTKTAG